MELAVGAVNSPGLGLGCDYEVTDSGCPCLVPACCNCKQNNGWVGGARNEVGGEDCVDLIM